MFAFPSSARNAAPLASATLKHAIAHTDLTLGTARIHASTPTASATAALSTSVGNHGSITPRARRAPLSHMHSGGLSIEAPINPPCAPLMRCTSTLPPVFTPPLPSSPPASPVSPASPNNGYESYFSLDSDTARPQGSTSGIEQGNTLLGASPSLQDRRRSMRSGIDSLTLKLTTLADSHATPETQRTPTQRAFTDTRLAVVSSPYSAVAAAYRLAHASAHTPDTPVVEQLGLGFAGLTICAGSASQAISKIRVDPRARTVSFMEVGNEEDDDGGWTADTETYEHEGEGEGMDVDVDIFDPKPLRPRIAMPYRASQAAVNSWMRV